MRRLQLLSLLMLSAAAGVGATESVEKRLIEFEIQDQFKEHHRLADAQGRIVLLIGSDKGGSEFSPRWGDAIEDSLKEHPKYGEIALLRVANVRGVPFFLKGFIRGKFPKDRHNWVMLDWKGKIAEEYSFVPEAANVLLFAPTGVLVHQTAGREPDGDKLSGLVQVLHGLLDALP